MIYYKLILQDKVVGVGNLFYYWSERTNRYIRCEINEAMFIQNNIDSTFYHAMQLNTPSIEAPQVDDITMLLIDEVEYDELYEQLKSNEEVPFVPPAPPEPTPEPTPEPVPVETPMTIQQMRDKIIEQGQMIDMLTECLLEVSELIYEE